LCLAAKVQDRERGFFTEMSKKAGAGFYYKTMTGSHTILRPQRQKILFWDCVKRFFYGASHQIIFGCRHLFPDFAKQNQEKDVYIQRI
jgi:hypothetical protein